MESTTARTNRKDNKKSWIIVFGIFWLGFIETGVFKSFGVLLPNIQEQFATQTPIIGVSIALIPGVGSVICILMGGASKILQPRSIMTICGMIGSLGLVMASFAPNVYVLMLTLSITGVSSGITAVATGVLSQHFDEHYNVAMTITNCGVSLGIIIMPLVTQFLFDIYGWRGTTLLIAGLSLHSFVLSTLFKSAEPNYALVSKTEESNATSITTTHTSRCNSSYRYIVNQFDLDLFCNFSFVALFVIAAGNGYCLSEWFIYVIPHALDAGFSPYEASAIATAGGIGGFVGNCLGLVQSKIMSNKMQLNICAFVMSVSLALDAVTSIFSSYVGMFLCSLVYNIFRSSMIIAQFAFLNDELNEEQMISAIGWSFAAYGLMSILSGFVSGWLYDFSGNYATSYFVLSAVSAVSFIPKITVDMRNSYHTDTTFA